MANDNIFSGLKVVDLVIASRSLITRFPLVPDCPINDRFLASLRLRSGIPCGFLRGRRTVAGHCFSDSRGRGRYFPDRPYSLRSKYRRARVIRNPRPAYNRPRFRVPGLFRTPSADPTRKPAQRQFPSPVPNAIRARVIDRREAPSSAPC